MGGVFVAVAAGRPLWLGLNLTTMAALFLCGVASGACLSASGGLDRLDAYAAGRVGPTVALGVVSVVSFPAAAALYVALGVAQRGFNTSTNRLLSAVAAVVVVLAGASLIGNSGSEPIRVLLWGGNLAYLGALSGWAVADGVKR